MSVTNSENAIFELITCDVLNAVLYGSQKNRRKMIVAVDDCQDSRLGRPSKSATVPEQIYVGRPSTVFGQSVGVFASTAIRKGTVMGPYGGRRFSISQIGRSSEMNIESEQLWEVLRTDGQLDHFVGMSSSDEKNWMTFVNCARHVSEQTLDMVQIGWNIYYIANKNILPHEELLVWYSDSTKMFFDVPIFQDSLTLHAESSLNSKFEPSDHQPGENFISHRANQKDGSRESLGNRSILKMSSTDVFRSTNHLPQHTRCWSTAEVSTDHHRQNGQITRDSAATIGGDELSHPTDGDRLEVRSAMALADRRRDLRCPTCGRMFNTRSNLRSHTRIHTLEKPFTCRFCQRGFSQSSTLRNHLRLHTGEKPYRCNDCQCSYSQLAGLRAHQRSVRHNRRSNADTASPSAHHLLMTAQPFNTDNETMDFN